MGTVSPLTIQSVGIDIGTSTTQLVVSRLTVKNTAPGALVPRLAITDKVVLYKSEIHRTPIDDNNSIDADKIFALIHADFERAGISPQEIDTGAVIITGETARRQNAKNISAKVAEFSGEFVVATAGGKLEAIIAGKGSGAADRSRRDSATVANIDIGGGTTNIGVFRNGTALDSCCINLGGRMLEVSRSAQRVTAISAPMHLILNDLRVGLGVGDDVTFDVLRRICQRMARLVLECLGLLDVTSLAKKLLTTSALRLDYELNTIMVSGGVADYVYSPNPNMSFEEAAEYDDIGPLFGSEFAALIRSKSVPMEKPVETIRATVIGAGAQTLDVSGSTILVDDQLLPLKNVPVAFPFQGTIPLDIAVIARTVAQSINNFYDNDSLEKIAIGLPGNQYFAFKDVQILAAGLLQGLDGAIRKSLPVIIVLEADIGKVLGQSMRAINGKINVVCIDQLVVAEGDYIDIGKSLAGGAVVPVIIKTLVFETKQI
tara:strand:- start:114421 stop:115884 length:1464 start_codon:yes stop_codon:yes gene_type:complete